MKKIWNFIIILTLACIVMTIFYARWMEPEMLIVKKITVETDTDIENCKAIFFTDTHFGVLYGEKHAKNVVDKINGLDADIVIFGGDLLDDYARDARLLDMDYLREELGRIEAKEGKYAVFGNHDYGGGAFRIYQEFMESCGFEVLKNQYVALQPYRIGIIGYDDYLLGETNSGFYEMPDNQFHIIATHEPIISKFISGPGEHFVLSGHTHGGQVSVPYFTKKLLPTGSDQFVKGFYTACDIGTQQCVKMYVSSGIGMTKYPFRFGNVPEIIEIDFRKKE